MPEEYREEFQRELAKLRDAAPTVSFKQMRKVIEDDLEERIPAVFESFDEQPIAAASIGQVYRARLREDGREVAVKVQYPGVAAAVRADMQNLEMIMRLLKRMTPQLDVRAVAREIRERIGEELDYELEAQNQRSLARIFHGHPFIKIPDVVTELSRERVLVTELVQGVGFEELKGYPQAARDRIGEIVFRFFLGCLYRHRQFSGDPHPGNFMLLGDGRVAFLDFGLFKRLDPAPVELELAAQRAVIEHDAPALHELLARVGLPARNPSASTPRSCWRSSRTGSAGIRRDEVVALTPEIATEVMIESSDPRSSHFRQMRHQDMRAEHLFGRRMEMLTLAVLSQLRATRQLAPDRARVDLRRSARHRAGARRGRVLRAWRGRRGELSEGLGHQGAAPAESRSGELGAASRSRALRSVRRCDAMPTARTAAPP